MTIYLKQSTASQEVALGFFVDSTDGNTEKTALTIAAADIRLYKAGGTTLVTPAAGATHISNGIYYWVADATDTNTLGSMAIYCHPTGALATKVECVVLSANIYDSLIGGTDLFDVSMTQILGTAVATPATAGVLDANVKNINNVAAATPGAANGLLISGSNSGTTTLGALTITGVTSHTGATVHTGNVSMAAGLTITQSVLNTSALAITGNGSGHGMITAGGATGSGLVAQGNGSGRGGMEVYGVVGPGLYLEGGSGVDGHGILVQGGTNGDGLKAVGAGTGVPIRGNITGNITGTITTATNLTTNNDKTGYAIGVGGIAATAFAAGAIDNAAIAADAIGSSELAQTAAREIADEVLDRDLVGGASGGSRNVRNALRSLRNKAAISAGTLTVYQEDDTTSAWTAVVATTAGNPISSIDPA